MRYILLLISLAVFAVLVYMQFTAGYSIFSDKKENQVRIQDVKPQVENMQDKVNRYNKTVDQEQKRVNDALK